MRGSAVQRNAMRWSGYRGAAGSRKVPAAIFGGGLVSELDSAKKERAAASMFKARAPHRSSCSRRAEVGRGPSTEIRLDLDSAPQTHEPLLAFLSGEQGVQTEAIRRRTSKANQKNRTHIYASGLFR